VDKVLSELEESGDRFVLVIDDLHELSSPEAAGQLTALLTRLPPGVRAVVATRRDLPLRLHKLRLAGDLAEIRAAQLRFTEHETRQLLAAAGITLPEQTTAMLHQRTEGWAAGLRLAVLSLTWFRYHRMFRGLLRLELRRTMPADIAGLHRLAARWLAARGQAADAIGHLQAAGDWDEAARMLTDHALSLTLDGQAGTVAALLRYRQPGGRGGARGRPAGHVRATPA